MKGGDCGQNAPDWWHWCVAPRGHPGPHVAILHSRAWYEEHGYREDPRLDRGVAFADAPPRWAGWNLLVSLEEM